MAAPANSRYLDYQLVISHELYWYRRRTLRQSDGELQEEVIGFNRFEPNEARLYACRIAWSASGASRDLRPLLTLDVYEEGGRSRFVTPDGRRARADAARRELAVRRGPRCSHSTAAGAGP